MEHRKYYVTKWFLTNGIKEVPGIPHEDSDYISVRMPGRRFSNSLRLGTDVFETKSEAEARGKVLLTNEIVKTEKYLSSLQNKLVAMEENRGVRLAPGADPGWRAPKKNERKVRHGSGS